MSATKSEVLNQQQFSPEKPDDVYRIVCLGGSTTYGRPFFDQTSFPGWLRELLPAAQPSTRWEVINAGGISYASYRVLGVMEELAQYDPDLFIVYTGQNEFLERRTYDGWSVSEAFAGPASLIYRTRTATIVRDVLDATGLRRSAASARKPELGEKTKSIPIDAVGPEAYHRDEDLNAEIVTHFRATLQKMADVAKQAEAKMILVVPASNLADFAPFRSQHREGISDAELATWNRHESQALNLLSQQDFESALTEIQQAEKIDDRYAALWYLKGRALFALDRFEEAKQAFLRARDEDVCPLRAIDPLVQVVREVGDAAGIAVVDFERLVEQNSEHGLPGDSMFHDHVHPTMKGNQLLAEAILDEMSTLGVVQPGADWDHTARARVAQQIEQRIDREEYARQLRLLSAMMGWLNQPAAARTQADLSLEYSGRTEAALLDLAAGFQANKAPALALEYLQRAVEVAPQSPKSQFQCGVSAIENGNSELGLQHLQMAVQLDPSFAEARERLGVQLAMQGSFPEAEKQLTVAVQLTPDSAMAHSNLGLVIARQGRFQEAVGHYQKSLALDNRISSTHFNAGLAYEELGQFQQARDHYQATIQLANGHADAQRRLREILNR